MARDKAREESKKRARKPGIRAWAGKTQVTWARSNARVRKETKNRKDSQINEETRKKTGGVRVPSTLGYDWGACRLKSSTAGKREKVRLGKQGVGRNCPRGNSLDMDLLLVSYYTEDQPKPEEHNKGGGGGCRESPKQFWGPARCHALKSLRVTARSALSKREGLTWRKQLHQKERGLK